MRRFSPAFSLVELLVVLAILSTLCALLVKLTGETQGLVGSNMHRMDADSQAQLVFDRLSLDLAGIPDRVDLPWSIDNHAGSTALLKFLSGVASSGDERKLSLIAYRLAPDTSTHPGMPCLQRAAKGVNWDHKAMGLKTNGIPVTFDDLSASLALSDPDFDVLSTGVFRISVHCLRRDNGTIQNTLPLTPAKTPDLQNLAGLAVTLVVVDSNSLKFLTPVQADSVAAVFTLPPDGTLPGSRWSELSNNPETFAGIPKLIARSIRIYQRFFQIGGNLR